MTVHLDQAAGAPLRPEALEAMLPWLRDHWGNPSGSHRAARRARQAIDEARAVIAGLAGARPGEVVLTSGGTEADDLAVHGVLDVAGAPPVPVCSAVEHHAVLSPVEQRGGRVAPVGPDGVIDLDALRDRLGPDVGLVSVMLANNETGVVQPLAEVAAVVAEAAPAAVLHTDAVQAAAWLDVAALAAPARLVSLTAHKLGGPKGVGALVVRDGTDLAPRLRGGGQERGRRAGTHNVAGIVGFGAAVAALSAERDELVARTAALADRLAAGLLALPGVRRTVPAGTPRLPSVVHVLLEGVDAEEVLFLLDERDVAASAGASCSSGALEPSHVLTAMGVPAQASRGALRLSLGWGSTEADVDAGVAAVAEALERLRARPGLAGSRP